MTTGELAKALQSAAANTPVHDQRRMLMTEAARRLAGNAAGRDSSGGASGASQDKGGSGATLDTKLQQQTRGNPCDTVH
jgi:hypothetical protein